jgi:hypothetical protein
MQVTLNSVKEKLVKKGITLTTEDMGLVFQKMDKDKSGDVSLNEVCVDSVPFVLVFEKMYQDSYSHVILNDLCVEL